MWGLNSHHISVPANPKMPHHNYGHGNGRNHGAPLCQRRYNHGCNDSWAGPIQRIPQYLPRPFPYPDKRATKIEEATRVQSKADSEFKDIEKEYLEWKRKYKKAKRKLERAQKKLDDAKWNY